MNPTQAKEQIGAQYFQTMIDGKTPQMYYRTTAIKFNTGETSETLQYYSSCGGGWMNSADQTVAYRNSLIPC